MMATRSMFCTQFSSASDAEMMARQVCLNANCRTRQEFYDALADMTLAIADEAIGCSEAADLQDDGFEAGA